MIGYEENELLKIQANFAYLCNDNLPSNDYFQNITCNNSTADKTKLSCCIRSLDIDYRANRVTSTGDKLGYIKSFH